MPFNFTLFTQTQKTSLKPSVKSYLAMIQQEEETDEIIFGRIALFQKHFSRLQSIDHLIFYSTLTALFLSLFFNSVFCLGLGAIDASLIVFRANKSLEYKNTLRDLTQCLEAKIEYCQAHPGKPFFTPAIKKLMLSIGPWVSTNIISQWEQLNLELDTLTRDDPVFFEKLMQFSNQQFTYSPFYVLYGLDSLEEKISRSVPLIADNAFNAYYSITHGAP